MRNIHRRILPARPAPFTEPWPVAGIQSIMRMPMLLSLLLASAGADAAPVVERTLRAGDTELHVVVDASSRERAEQLHRWMAEVANASLTAFGRFPLEWAEVRVREIRSSDSSPVPWGQTSRRDEVAVLLYVRDDASLDQLRSDWTAVHELAHLFHPYLGRRGRWLAEGLASYYQNVLRARAGLLGEEQAWRRLDAGFGRGRGATSGVRLDELGRGGTMRVYWAGAAYWLEADLALRARGSDLDSVLARYAECCLRGGGTVEPAGFVAELDRIAGGEVFGDRYRRYASSLEFPSLDAAYRQLGISVGNASMRFSPQPDAARLRQAVMGRRSAPPVATPRAGRSQ
jgi:hypothetical protein